LSGPAGGVVGALDVARQALEGEPPHLITFDMGGTSTDVALCPGVVPTTAESMIGDLPLRLPLIDIHTVGAGGGSVAYMDAGGGLRVGPRSAGAVPGPACYGRGGQEATVTDANLVLGRLDPQGFLGGAGDVALDADASWRVLATLGQAIGLGPEAAALGVVQIANAVMEQALRRVSVERGYDPRRFTLLPFGGAGPLHACELAQALDIRRILIPPFPGVLSAYGMLVADVVHDASQTILRPANELVNDPSHLTEIYTDLMRQVQSVLAQEGFDEPQMEAALDLRYQGQSYELTVPLLLPIVNPNVASAVEAFHQSHAQRYGYAMPDEPVTVVTLRVAGRGPGAQPTLPRQPVVGEDATTAQLGERLVWFTPDGPTPTPVYMRTRLQAGNRFAGPALVLQYDATVVVAPGWAARVDPLGNLWLDREKA
jgi:N-methylhydantoinase A